MIVSNPHWEGIKKSLDHRCQSPRWSPLSKLDMSLVYQSIRLLGALMACPVRSQTQFFDGGCGLFQIRSHKQPFERLYLN